MLTIQLRAPAAGTGLRIPLVTSSDVVVLPDPVLFSLGTSPASAFELATNSRKPIDLGVASTIELEILS